MASELPLVIDEELLCCSLCMRSFREPRILPCLHTFCKSCLEAQLARTWPRFAEQLAAEESSKQLSPLPEACEQFNGDGSPETSTEQLRTEPETKTEAESAGSDGKVSNNNVGGQGEEGRKLDSQSPKSVPSSKHHPPLPHKPPGLVVPPLPPGAVVKMTPAGAAVIIPKHLTSAKDMQKEEPCDEYIQAASPPLHPRSPETFAKPSVTTQEVNTETTVEQIQTTSPPLLPRSPETFEKSPLNSQVTKEVADEQIQTIGPPLLPRSPETLVKSPAISQEVTKGVEAEYILATSPPLHPRSPETFTKSPVGQPEAQLKDEIPGKTSVPSVPAMPAVPDIPISPPLNTGSGDLGIKGTHQEPEEGYYEECGVYEEVEQNPEKIIINITDEDDEEGNFYYCAEPQESKAKPEKEPTNKSIGKVPETNEKDEETETIEKAATPKPSKGWFISSIFRRSSPKKEKSKVKKPDISIKRSKSAPDAGHAIRELPSPPHGALSPYSPSPTTGRALAIQTEDTKKSTTSLPLITGCQELTPDGTPALPPRNTVRQPPPLPTKRSISLAPNPTTVPTTPTPSIASLPAIPSSGTSISGTIPQAPFSGNPAIVKCPNTPQNKETMPVPQSQTEVRMNCPTCQTEFIVPSSGIRGLKVNSFALSLQDVVLSQSSDEKNCNNCETSAAKFRCLDCRHYLCSGCRNAHNWLKITKSHRVMTLGELQSGRYQKELTQKQEIKCDVHKQNKVELMCLYCDKPICSECKIHEHFEHRAGHLNEAADRDRDLITSLINSVKDQTTLFHDTKEQLSQYDLQCTNEKKELIECLGKQRDLIIGAVNDAFLDLVQEIDTAYTQETTNANGVKAQIDATITHMTHNCMLAEQLLAHGKTEDILLMSRLMKVNLNNFSFAAPFELDTRAFVQYSPTGFQKPMMVSLFGRLAKRRSDIVRPKHIVQHRILEKGAHQASDDFVLLHSYRAKTLNDALGCKPSGLTISMNDDIVIVDDTNKKVKVFDPSGIVKMELKPLDEHAFIDPWDVTITYQGYLAVTDRGSRSVKVFDSRGRFVYEFGPHLKSPWGIAANSHGHLIVTDILAKTVFVHDQAGNMLHQIECKGHSNLFVCPEYVKINHNDDIIVSDFMKHCITVFDSQGRFLFRYGTRGNGVHEFTTPCGIGVNKSGHILVADYSNKRIHKLTRDGQFIRFILTAQHGLVIPQTLSVNSQGHLVVIDGANIKTFGVLHDSHDDSDSDVDPIYEPLQFSNKLYEGAGIRFSRIISESEA